MEFQQGVFYSYGCCFCWICGILLGEILFEEDSFLIVVNVLDMFVVVINKFYEFVVEKLFWYEICDVV